MIAERLLVVAVFLGFGIAGVQSAQAGVFPPPPSRFVGLALIGTVLGVVSLASPQLAAALAVAVLLGLIIAGRQFYGNKAPSGGSAIGIGGGGGGGGLPIAS